MSVHLVAQPFQTCTALSTGRTHPRTCGSAVLLATLMSGALACCGSRRSGSHLFEKQSPGSGLDLLNVLTYAVAGADALPDRTA